MHLAVLIGLWYITERIELVQRSLLIQLLRLTHLTPWADVANMIDLLHGRTIIHAALYRCGSCLRGRSMLLVATSRVWIVVNS